MKIRLSQENGSAPSRRASSRRFAAPESSPAKEIVGARCPSRDSPSRERAGWVEWANGDLAARVHPHPDRHPFGNEKCCSLAFCSPSPAKAGARPKREKDGVRYGGGVGEGPSFRASGGQARAARHREFAVCPANLSSGQFLLGRRGLQRGFDEVDEVMRFSARGVAAMTEANGRTPSP